MSNFTVLGDGVIKLRLLNCSTAVELMSVNQPYAAPYS